GPSVCDRIFRVTPGVVAGGVVCAEASAAMNSASPQIAQPATPVKFLRVSMAISYRPRAPMSGNKGHHNRFKIGLPPQQKTTKTAAQRGLTALHLGHHHGGFDDDDGAAGWNGGVPTGSDGGH